ncbi:MAG: alpha/beta fold hydrolase [Muribaculaceae bacterium]|nr:alpha/beta fold hydrolase [Muribaculaceae bacterium]
MKIKLHFLSFFLLSLCIFNMAADEIHLQGSKGKLYGKLEYPGQVINNVKYPLVILCHGFNGNSGGELWDTLSKDIVDSGMACLRFDFNGHGKSEGDFQDMTVPNEVEDLKEVVKWAQEQPWVESIALVGHSQGGVVVSMVAGELGDSIIKAEVLMAPAAVLKEDAIRGNTMGARYNPWALEGEYVELPAFHGMQPIRLGRAYIESALYLPIYETARNYNGPTLLIHGTHDFVVPFTYSQRYKDEIKGSELKLVEGDNHMFTESINETCETVTEWLKKILQPSPIDPIQY